MGFSKQRELEPVPCLSQRQRAGQAVTFWVPRDSLEETKVFRLLISLMLFFATASVAIAEPVTYVLATPGVV